MINHLKMWTYRNNVHSLIGSISKKRWNISSRFSNNHEAVDSELLDNIEGIFIGISCMVYVVISDHIIVC